MKAGAVLAAPALLVLSSWAAAQEGAGGGSADAAGNNGGTAIGAFGNGLAVQRAALGGAESGQQDLGFVVANIKVMGLQRISEGTVFNYLPVDIGDRLTPQRLREAIRALYATGFFRDVQMWRVGGTLIVAVTERPSLESVDLKGNKDIKTEDLQKSLRQVGLAAGKTFDRSTLDELTQYLTDQYYSRGKYAVQIDAKVENLPGNRVRVNINIVEGERARIRQINIVGDTHFPEKDILATLALKTPNLQSWYSQDDRYSRESLQGDLEKIATYYQDRGYANFRIDSVQVTIAPDKKDMFITVNVTEGKVYTLGTIRLGGNLIIPEDQMQKLVLMKTGQIYSQKVISATQELIRNRLGEQGFYFAKVEPVPQMDEAHNIVNLTLFVDPGNRTYVRHINFTGSDRANDETLRRQLRQLEGGWLSNTAVDLSKERLQRLPFVENVDVKTDPVAGSPDQVDMTFDVKERSSAQIGGGIGYSASQKFMLNGNFSDSDFMGGGNSVAVEADAGIYNKVYSVSHTNPFVTIDGLSRTVSLSYRDSTQLVSESSNFSSRNLSLGLNYGYPISERQGINFGVSLQHVDLLTYSGSSALQTQEWVEANGHPYSEAAVYSFREPDGTATSVLDALDGSDYNTAELTAGWVYDARNRALFADRGVRSSISVRYVPPGSTVRYWIGDYAFAGYVPLWGRWTLSFNDKVEYGNGLGHDAELPPYLRFYGGGPDGVRGFTEDTLGPVDTNGNPYGGNLNIVTQTELILPIPEKWQTSARATLFFDMGNVFSNDHTVFYGSDLQTPESYKFSYHDLKQSTGIAVQWMAPSLGIFRFSYGIPLNAERANGVKFGDQTENFQFTVGQSF